MRFSLTSLLLVPLRFSPLAMSFVLVADELARRQPRLGISIFAFAAVYSLILLTNWHAQLGREGHMPNSPVLSSLARGAMYGGLFCILLFLPVFGAFFARQWKGEPFLTLWEALISYGPNLAGGFAYVVLTFTAVGAAVGCIFGLGIELGGRRTGTAS